MALMVNDVFLLEYISGRNKDFALPDYLLPEYGSDWKVRVDNFLNDGYLSLSDYKDNMKKITIPELKEVLKDHGLKVTGKKQDLIDSILANIDHEELKERFSSSMYVLTEKGQAFIDDNYVFLANKKRGYGFLNTEITETIQTLKSQNENFSNNDIIWALLNKKQLHSSAKKDWGTFTRCQYQMSEFLHAEGKCENSLIHLCVGLYTELSGMNNGNMVESFSLLIIPPAYIRLLDGLLSKSNFGIDDFKDFFLTKPIALFPKLPFCYFTIDQIASLLCDVLKGEDVDVSLKKYQHKTPIENSSTYTYYNFDKYDNDDVVSLDVRIEKTLDKHINKAIEQTNFTVPDKKKKMTIHSHILWTVSLLWTMFWSIGTIALFSVKEFSGAILFIVFVLLGLFGIYKASKRRKKD